VNLHTKRHVFRIRLKKLYFETEGVVYNVQNIVSGLTRFRRLAAKSLLHHDHYTIKEDDYYSPQRHVRPEHRTVGKRVGNRRSMGENTTKQLGIFVCLSVSTSHD
jgi:hypothetical protein